MKLKISFELDVTGTCFSIKDKNDEVTAVLQNTASLLQELQNIQHSNKIDILVSKCDDKMKKAMLQHYDEKIKILSTMFDNWSVEGVMEDGNRFVFTHKEPGYQEELKFI